MLTDEERERIRLEEQYRLEIRRQLEAETPPARAKPRGFKANLWTFLNAPFGIWVLSAIFVAFGGTVLNHYLQDRTKAKSPEVIHQQAPDQSDVAKPEEKQKEDVPEAQPEKQGQLPSAKSSTPDKKVVKEIGANLDAAITALDKPTPTVEDAKIAAAALDKTEQPLTELDRQPTAATPEVTATKENVAGLKDTLSTATNKPDANTKLSPEEIAKIRKYIQALKQLKEKLSAQETNTTSAPKVQ